MHEGTALDGSEVWQYRVREKEASEGDTLDLQAKRPCEFIVCR